MKSRYDEFNRYEYEAHQLEFGLIDHNSRVLDIGCATGLLAKELTKKDCETWGVDGDKGALTKAKKYLKKSHLCNLEDCTKLPFPKKYFDYITLFDVIEHLQHPEIIISTIKPHLKKDGRILISTPNIAHASIRWMLLKGEFEYTTTGIMDSTHVHLYTEKSLKVFLKKMGLRVIRIIPTNGMCKVPFLYIITDRLPASWQYYLVKILPTLFSYQFIVVTKPRKR